MALESIIDRVDRNMPKAFNSVDRGVRRTAGTLESTFDSIRNVAYDGLHLGVGLVAIVSENLSSFFKETVDYGEKVERKQLRKLSSLKSDAVDRVKGIFSVGKDLYDSTEVTVENTVDDVVDELEIPRGSEIRRLSRKVNKVSHDLAEARPKIKANGKAKSARKKKANLKASATKTAKSRIAKAKSGIAKTKSRTKKAYRTASTKAKKTISKAKSRARSASK
jgi:hypothetical protein